MNPADDPGTDLLSYNRRAWNRQAASQCQWSRPVTPAAIAAARRGEWEIVLTPVKPVPREWFPDFRQQPTRVLCLAGSGGQQAPILAAAGAQVTVFDLSPGQLELDRQVAQREGLQLELVQGDMRDLGQLADESFDLIVHPCSNCFVPQVRPVWREAARVLRVGGTLLSGVTLPVFYLFDQARMEQGHLDVAYKIPYSDLADLPEDQRQALIDQEEPFLFGHTLTDQIAGQLEAGFALRGFYEDRWPEYEISRYIACFAGMQAQRIA